MTHKQTLIIFTRYPEAGKTKTRLIPVLGAKGAADFHQKMTEETLNKALQLATKIPVNIELHFCGGNQQLMLEWLGKNLTFKEQIEGDLGLKMQRAFRQAFQQNNNQKVIIIGTDCPNLNESILKKAFVSLENNDLIIGPATDGGYYLIGLNRLIVDLFIDINWGSSEVLKTTEKIANKLELKIYKLPLLNDIDNPEDLQLL